MRRSRQPAKQAAAFGSKAGEIESINLDQEGAISIKKGGCRSLRELDEIIGRLPWVPRYALHPRLYADAGFAG